MVLNNKDSEGNCGQESLFQKDHMGVLRMQSNLFRQQMSRKYMSDNCERKKTIPYICLDELKRVNWNIIEAEDG